MLLVKREECLTMRAPVVMLLPARETPYEIGFGMMRLFGLEESFLDGPIVSPNIQMIESSGPREPVLSNPGFRLVQVGEHARRELSSVSVKHPYRGPRCFIRHMFSIFVYSRA